MRSSRSHIYLAVDTETDALVAHQDSLDRPARRSILPEAVHDGGMGRPAHRQPARLEAAFAFQKTEFPVCGERIHRRANPDPMDDRQSKAGTGNGARHRRAGRPGSARLSPVGNAAPGFAAGKHHDRQDRNGQNHRFRFDQNHRRGRNRAVCRPQRHSGHRPIQRAGIFRGRRRLAALRHVLAGRDHLSDADGKLPYGAPAAKARTKSQLRKLRYKPAIDDHREIPAWVDGTLKKAVHPDPASATTACRNTPSIFAIPMRIISALRRP